MSILLLFFLAFNSIFINSKIVSQKVLDSLLANLPDTVSDSATVEIVVRALFGYLEGRGVIDPQIEVLMEEGGITIFVKNERIVPISRVYVDLNGNLRSYGYLNSFLNRGFFSKESLSKASLFFNRLEFFEVKDYRFLKSKGKYDLILGTNILTPLPTLAGGLEKDRFWFKSSINYSNLYYFPLRLSLNFSIIGRRIQGLRGKVVLPVDIGNGLFLSAEMLQDSSELNYGLIFGKVMQRGRMQLFYRVSRKAQGRYGFSVITESANFSAVLKLEMEEYLRHLLYMEYESKNSIGPGLVILKSTVEEQFPLEGKTAVVTTGLPYLKPYFKIKNLIFYKTLFVVNYYGLCFRLPTKSGTLHLGLSYPSHGNSLRDLEVNFGLSKRSILFDYLSTFN